MNYLEHNKELHGALYKPEEPVIFTKADSALLKDGKPFFIPDHLGRIEYETELVVRICRLGKTIPQRFAHRYYDAVTVGIDFTARELQQKLSCSAVIHMDPVITDDPEINELRHKVTDIVYRLDEQLTLHDFRIIRGPTHTNVIFDVVVPFHFKMTDAQLRSWLDKRIKQIDPSYFCVINIDKN